jgi:hypothetical protein
VRHSASLALHMMRLDESGLSSCMLLRHRRRVSRHNIAHPAGQLVEEYGGEKRVPRYDRGRVENVADMLRCGPALQLGVPSVNAC